MTTYSFSGFTLVEDEFGVVTSLSASEIEIHVNSVFLFTTYLNMADPYDTMIATSSSANVRVDGTLVGRFDMEIAEIFWGSGNSSIIMVYGQDIGTSYSSSAIVLDGDPIDLANLGEAQTFLDSVSAVSKVTIGDYAPDPLFWDGILVSSFLSLTGMTEDDNFVDTGASRTKKMKAGDDIYFGMGGDDTAFGGMGNDTMNGGEGNDSIDGESNFDVLHGDLGDDTLMGGDGHDELYGDEGYDSLFGGTGNDTMDGGSESDELYGEAGHDLMYGGNNSDFLFGGTERDTIYGDNGNDFLEGENGNDRLFGGNGADYLNGGGQADRLVGGQGNDDLTGGTQADVFIFTINMGRDLLRDFSAAEGDELNIHNSLVGGSTGITDAALIAAYATDLGDHIRLDLEGGNSIMLLNVANTSDLLGQINVF